MNCGPGLKVVLSRIIILMWLKRPVHTPGFLNSAELSSPNSAGSVEGWEQTCPLRPTPGAQVCAGAAGWGCTRLEVPGGAEGWTVLSAPFCPSFPAPSRQDQEPKVKLLPGAGLHKCGQDVSPSG